MAAAMPVGPLQVWPEGLQHVQHDLMQLRQRNPRYESYWFGALVTMFGFVFPSATPQRFYVRPQFTLRPPVGNALPAEDAPGPDLVDPDPSDGEDEEEAGNTSLISQGYRVQGRGQGREMAIRIPDFMIDYSQGDGAPRRFLLLIEVKASIRPNHEDIRRFSRYALRLQQIEQAGVAAIQNIVMMLIAGGHVYTWDFAHLPLDFELEDLLAMEFLQADSTQFLDTLFAIRDHATLL
ncbi:hypothetical protein FRC10_000380 [Ceratobasidium sp. 414]|nr:hypothetical protein FRC10_000380 [Ceratobasidium sp. 414]